MDALRLPERLAARLPGRLGDDGRPVVPLVRLHGVITPTTGPAPRSVINSVTTEKVLERAFERDRVAAVALLVNSPGGSPTQSALVADRIRGLAEEHDVPVLAFCVTPHPAATGSPARRTRSTRTPRRSSARSG